MKKYGLKAVKAIGSFMVICVLLEVLVIEDNILQWSKSSFQLSKSSILQSTIPRILLTASKNSSVQSTSRRHMIINSYMCSGSSFFGKLMGFRPDTFYWFELLSKYGGWDFMNGSSYVCDSRTCDSCVKSQLPTTITRVLNDFFGCNFASLTSVLDPETTQFSGPLWKYNECGKGSFNSKSCLTAVQKHCTAKPHIVAKALRSSLDNYGQFLDQDPNAILLQLFRDPRAVVNSRLHKYWYKPFHFTGKFTKDAECLCSRMIMDFNYGVEFQNKYPGRVIFVIYEDLLSDLPHKLNRLYKRIGMSTIDDFKTNANKEFCKLLSLYKNNTSSQTSVGRKDYAFWWRANLAWGQVQEIDRHCKDIYDAIGFKAFNTSLTFNNMQIPSVEVREHLRL